MYNALSVEVPAGRSIAVLCPLSGTGPVCPMIHKCLSLGQGLWFITFMCRIVHHCNWQHSGEFDPNFSKMSDAPGFAPGGRGGVNGRFWN